MRAFIAIDLGASSGRVIVGRVLNPADSTKDGSAATDTGSVARVPVTVAASTAGALVDLIEVRRFPNGPVAVGDTLRWDVLRIFQEILTGLRTAARMIEDQGDLLSGIGIDSWAVDYGLLDSDGELLGNPVHYRDPRTIGVPQQVYSTLSARDHYATNGLQTQPFNTEFQVVAASGTAQLAAARHLLLMPDLLTFWLTGKRCAEVTNASTTGLLDVRTRTWSASLVAALSQTYDLPPLLGPEGILPRLVEPGEVVGHFTKAVARSLGIAPDVPVIAVGSHDTASAVVAVPAVCSDFAYISCGTWSLVGLELNEPVLTDASREANFTNELGVDGTVRYLRNVMGLWLLQESLRTWEANGQPHDLGELLIEAGQVPPLRTVIDVNAPELMAPGDMPRRIRAVAERHKQPEPRTRAEVVRCVLDSLALAYRRAVRHAGELAGRAPEQVHLVGGGVHNVLLCQLTADATGLPVVAGPVEAAALGNVLVQARTVGALTGDLAALRAVGVRGAPLVTYLPGAINSINPEAWEAAECRVFGMMHGASRHIG